MAAEPRNTTTPSGRELARQSLSKPVRIDQIVAIETEAADYREAEVRADIRAKVEGLRETAVTEERPAAYLDALDAVLEAAILEPEGERTP